MSGTDWPADRVERALEQNLWSLWSRFGRGDGCALHAADHALWFDTPIPTLPYNGVLRFVSDVDVDARIDAIVGHYHRRGVPFLWMVHPSARPADLAARLVQRGLQEAETCAGMWRELDALPAPAAVPPGIDVHEATADSDVRGVFELVTWRWEVPAAVAPRLPGVVRAFDVGGRSGAVRAWIARQRGLPVAKVILHVSDKVAGIYGVVTRPEARGLGLASILTLQALDAARTAGCAVGVLHATPMARALYQKLGFRVHALFKILAPPGSLHV